MANAQDLIYFNNLNIDISYFVSEPTYGSAHIARFLKSYCVPFNKFELSTNLLSGVHDLSYKGKIILSILDGMVKYQLTNPYYKGNLLIDIPQLEPKMSYFKEIIKNIFFFEYLAFNNLNYSKYEPIYNNKEDLFAEFIDSLYEPFDHPSGLECLFDEKAITISHNHFNYTIKVFFHSEKGFIFSISMNNHTYMKTANFNKFIKSMYDLLYVKKIQPHINVSAHQFSKEYGKIVEMYLQ